MIRVSVIIGQCVLRLNSATEIRISELSLPRQAARWTALQVYKQHYHKQYETDSYFKGFRGFPLTLVAPDLRTIPEAAQSADEADFTLGTAYSEDLTSDSEVSIFIAKGDDLLSAAQTMARCYSQLLVSSEVDPFLSELDASMTVAQALGATSMEHFEDMWGQAMEQPDPRVAARYAYKTLTAA